MKTSLFALCAAFLLAFTSVGYSQTNSPVLAPPATNAPTPIKLPAISLNVPTNVTTVANDILTWFEPFIPSLTNRNFSIDAAALYHKSIGFGLDAEYNLSTNFSIGLGPQYVDHTWFIKAVSAKLGTDWTPPVIGQWTGPFHVSLQTGMPIQVSDAAIGSETMTIWYKEFTLSKNLTFDAEGGFGYMSIWNGTLWRASGKFNYNFN